MVIWAAMTFGYFGCLRAAEFTISDGQQFIPSVHFALQDVIINTHSPCRVVVRIKCSKTGSDIYNACTNNIVCVFCSITQILNVRIKLGFTTNPQSSLPGHSLSCLCLAGLGIDSAKYSDHSYRAGKAPHQQQYVTLANKAAGLVEK